MKRKIQADYCFKNFTLLLLLFIIGSCQSKTKEKPQVVDPFIQRLNDISEFFLTKTTSIAYDTTAIPRSLNGDGSLRTTGSKSWTSGFFPGTLWQLYDWSNEPQYKMLASKWMKPIEKEKFDRTTHDLGFKVYCSYGQAYRITQNNNYKNIILQAAKTLITRFNPNVGAIRSWDHHQEEWNYPVIVDNMLNLEMLFEATKMSGDSVFHKIAETHASTTLSNHFREDNSSYHVVSFNPTTGEVEKKNTHQGADHESAWSRGQSWGLYGFTLTYRYTKDKKFLEQAQKIADFIINHPNLPSDGIPYWDYDAPSIPNEPRDVSAAAIMASALLELSQYNKEGAKGYMKLVNKILNSLQLEKYQANNGPFILDHSVGSVPGEFEVDVPISYADYYYVETLLRRINHDKSKDQNI